MNRVHVKLLCIFALIALLGLGYFFRDQNPSKTLTESQTHWSDDQSSRRAPSAIGSESGALGSFESLGVNNEVIAADNIDDWLIRLQEMDYGDDYRGLLIKVANYYAENDPESGKKWLLSIENSPESIVAFSVFGSGYAKEYGLISLQFFDDITHSSFAETFLNSAACQLSLNDSIEVLNFVLDRSEKLKHPNSTVRSIANAAALNGTSEALKLIQGSNAGKSYSEVILAGIAYRIMSEEKWGGSMSGFLAEVDQIGHPEWAVNTVRSIVGATANSGFDELANVLRDLPESKVKDVGASEFAQRIAETAPRSAVYWVNEIGDKDARLEAAITIMSSVEKFDPALRDELSGELHLDPAAAQQLNSRFSK